MCSVILCLYEHADFVEHAYPPEIVCIFAYLDAMQ